MMKKLVLLLFLGSLIFSCGSKKSAARKRHSQNTKTEHVVIGNMPKGTQVITDGKPNSIEPVKISSTEQYLAMYSAIAQNEMRLYGIPASITLAQGILESNSGRGRLSVEANNHFGIKCHDWTGAKVYHDDDKAHECFRKYNDVKYSYRDHSLFLTMRRRYAKLFDLRKDDYKRWAKELKAAGYATDRKYPEKLIALIERYRLYKLDDEVLGHKNENDTIETTAIAESNEYNGGEAETMDVSSKKESVIASVKEIQEQQVKTDTIENNIYTVEKGDTLYSISKKYNMTVGELQDINGLTGSEISLGQKLQVKKGIESNTYTVEQGDTLYSISKKHNTTVQALQQLNNLNDNAVIIGQELLVK